MERHTFSRRKFGTKINKKEATPGMMKDIQ